jgi:hypothetical protein
MERMTPGMRPNGMMWCQRQARGLVAAGALCAALAGCGSVVASNQPGDVATAVPAAAPRVGCASVDQATTATIHRAMHLVEPVDGGPLTVIQHKAALVRALFSDMCQAVTHPETSMGLVHCPIDIGTDYSGTFYDGARVLATFVYSASGCQRVSLTAAGKTQGTVLFGRAADAAPHLESDLKAALDGTPQTGIIPPVTSVNPGGPNQPA